MPPGKFMRAVLGPAFQPLGEVYRRIFVDMDKVTDWMTLHIPANARLLDVGGGDGYVVNLLLEKRKDIQVTMTDLAPEIGGFISTANRSRATLRPATPVDAVAGEFDLITMADVVHHVPPAERPGFFAAVAGAARRTGCQAILVKDIQPGGLRANLAMWGDWYITGDRQVRQLPPEALAFPGFAPATTAMPDFPNYGALFRSTAHPSSNPAGEGREPN